MSAYDACASCHGTGYSGGAPCLNPVCSPGRNAREAQREQRRHQLALAAMQSRNRVDFGERPR